MTNNFISASNHTESYLNKADAESCLEELEKAGIVRVRRDYSACGCCWEYDWDEE